MSSKFQKSLGSSVTKSKYITNFDLHGRTRGTLPKKNGCDRDLFRSIHVTINRLLTSYESIINYKPRVTFKTKTTDKNLKLARWAAVTAKIMNNQIVWAGQCFFMRYRNLIGEIKKFVENYDYRSLHLFDTNAYKNCTDLMISIHKHANEMRQYSETLLKSSKLLTRAKHILKKDTSQEKMMKLSIDKINKTLKILYITPTLQQLQNYKRENVFLPLKKYGDSIFNVFKSITSTRSNKIINHSRFVNYKLPRAQQLKWSTRNKIDNPQFYQHRVLTSKAYKKGLL
jgi:hypothetical protein